MSFVIIEDNDFMVDGVNDAIIGDKYDVIIDDNDAMVDEVNGAIVAVYDS